MKKYFVFVEELACCAKRWLAKATNITKQNLPSFSPTGDINDAPFPIPQDILDGRERNFRTFLPSASGINEQIIVRAPPSVLTGPLPIDNECTYGLRTQKTEYHEDLFQIFSERHCTEDFLPRKAMSAPRWSLIATRWAIDSTRRSVRAPWRSGKTVRTDRTLNQSFRVTDEDNQKFVRRHGALTPKELDAYKQKFAQRMHENGIEFEKFCSTYTERSVRTTEHKKELFRKISFLLQQPSE